MLRSVAVFIIAMVILFPIILIGLAIENITDLRKEATAAHVASRLELASLLESTSALTQMCIQKYLPKKNTPNDKNTSSQEVPVAGTSAGNGSGIDNVTKNKSEDYPKRNEGLALQFTEHKFETIPEDIKRLIYNNKNIFPNGFHGDCE